MMNIEKGVKITSGNKKYPFSEMDIGDSVFFGGEPKATQSKPVLAGRSLGDRKGLKFSARSEGDGVRIWRVK